MEENMKSNVLQTLGKNIRQIRLLKGFSQENLANELQKSTNFISLLENGKTGISIQTLIDICQALDTDANTIFTGLISSNNISTDTFILNSLNSFGEKDKKIVADLITYILNSKD